ncbi:MAG: hypothetical protein KF819_06505 [Labilithrix sp.]|nr:hypothetical protein [Labilithrix sp.]
MRARTVLVSLLSLFVACSDEPAGAPDPTSDPRDGGGGDAAVDPSADGAVDGALPPTSTCELTPLADVTGATEVATEAALRAALAAGGKVRMTADITATSPLPVTTATILDGGGHTLSGGGTTHLLVATMTDLTVQNITIADARNLVSAAQHFSRQSGAAIMVSGGNGTTDGPAKGSLTVVKATFTGNHAEQVSNGDIRGGAVYVFNLPNAMFSETTFRNNVAVSGGAIGGLGSSLSIAASVFEGNEGNNAGRGGNLDGTGGAISLDALSQNGQTAYLRICGARFKENRAVRTGGAIYYVNHWKTGSVVEIRQSAFERNETTSTTEGQGGAIFAMDDDKYPANTGAANRTSVTESLFDGNTTWGQGGGIWFWTKDGSLLARNVTFHANATATAHETGMGGGLAISSGPATLLNCTFAANYAKFHGGGIQISGAADATLAMGNTLFVDNLSNRNGGYANFHTNRAVDTDLGGNVQHLDPARVIDVNSDALVAAGATRADPKLAPLADNGGPTPTMAIAAGSAAHDKGVSGASVPEVDQRLKKRDATPDVGAFELVP